jgi:hypothetical protein
MKLKWILIAMIAVALLDASPASARKRRAHVVVPNPCTGMLLLDIFRLECPPEPRWNGASPPVYVDGKYIGQDPDPRIRMQMQRDYYLLKDRY